MISRTHVPAIIPVRRANLAKIDAWIARAQPARRGGENLRMSPIALRRPLLAGLLLVLATACGAPGAGPAQAPTAAPVDPEAAIVEADMEDQIVYMTRYADEACACADASCAQALDARVEQTLTAEAQEELYSDEAAEQYQPLYSDRLGAAYGRYVQCLHALGVMPYSFGAIAVWSLERVTDRACACTDVACGRDAERRFRTWLAGNGHSPANEAQLARITTTSARFAGCVDDAYARSGEERGRDALIAFKALRTRACECADAACRNEARAAFTQWLADHGQDSTSARIRAELGEVGVELAACLPSDPAAPAAAVAEVERLREQACACSNARCADQVWANLGELSERHAETIASDEEVARFQAALDTLQACVVDAGGSVPTESP